jgi:hypothetical protein
MLRNGASWLREHPDRTAHEKLLLIYPWNAYGEGGFLTPTERDGYSFLEAVKRGLKLRVTAAALPLSRVHLVAASRSP